MRGLHRMEESLIKWLMIQMQKININEIKLYSFSFNIYFLLLLYGKILLLFVLILSLIFICDLFYNHLSKINET